MTLFHKKAPKKRKKRKNSGISRLSRDSEEPPLPEIPQISGLFHPELRGKGDGLAGSNKNRQVEGFKGCREHIGGIPDRDSDYLL